MIRYCIGHYSVEVFVKQNNLSCDISSAGSIFISAVEMDKSKMRPITSFECQWTPHICFISSHRFTHGTMSICLFVDVSVDSVASLSGTLVVK